MGVTKFNEGNTDVRGQAMAKFLRLKFNPGLSCWLELEKQGLRATCAMAVLGDIFQEALTGQMGKNFPNSAGFRANLGNTASTLAKNADGVTSP